MSLLGTALDRLKSRSGNVASGIRQKTSKHYSAKGKIRFDLVSHPGERVLTCCVSARGNAEGLCNWSKESLEVRLKAHAWPSAIDPTQPVPGVAPAGHVLSQ